MRAPARLCSAWSTGCLDLMLHSRGLGIFISTRNREIKSTRPESTCQRTQVFDFSCMPSTAYNTAASVRTAARFGTDSHRATYRSLVQAHSFSPTYTSGHVGGHIVHSEAMTAPWSTESETAINATTQKVTNLPYGVGRRPLVLP